jgi:hypothetical protein
VKFSPSPSPCAGARLDAAGRARLFKTINQGPTLFEIVMGQASRGGVGGMGRNRQEPVRCLKSPRPTSGCYKGFRFDWWSSDWAFAVHLCSVLKGGSLIAIQEQMTGVAQSSEAPLASGRLATQSDISVNLKGRRAEVHPLCLHAEVPVASVTASACCCFGVMLTRS